MRAFGRGTLEFIGGSNRKVLAYVRRDDRETIVVVANLSRTVQPASLNLQPFAGMIPVEMAGLTAFPRIGDQPYFLTLGAYACYWFVLQHEPAQVTPRASAAPEAKDAIAETLPALLMGVEWKNVLDSGTRTVLERQALAPFLQRQRWFASKAREIRRVSFSDWAPMRKGPEPAFLAIVAVEYADGWSDAYFLPLSLTTGENAERTLRESPGSVIARITGARKGAIVDAVMDDSSCDLMLEMVDGGREIASARGSMAAARIASPQSNPQSAIRSPQSRWHRGSGDQRHDLVEGQRPAQLLRGRGARPGSIRHQFPLVAGAAHGRRAPS
jgi:maltose alpha-D-glucosyltransferase/alpha-amylase